MDDRIDDTEDIAPTVRSELKTWESWASDWTKAARESYNYTHGKQWDETELAAMQEANRPAVTMNRISAIIRGICGLEVANRQAVRYLPREIGDVQANEVLNSAAQWVRDGCAAEDEESDAFRDMIICGMGWTETWLDYSENPEGAIIIERLDPLKCAWDATAKKRGLADASWVAAWKFLKVEEVKERWPDKADDITLDIEGDNDASGEPHSNDRAPWYESGMSGQKGKLKTIKVVQYQYYKLVPVYRVPDPATGQIVEIEPEKYALMAPMLEQRGLKGMKGTKREYRQAIVAGNVTLEDQPLPTAAFTIKCMTGIRNVIDGYFYGIVHDMKDPQRWSNKFFSLAIDIMASNAKGGIIAERDAFESPEKAESDWANPRAIVWARPGGIGKLQPRNFAGTPAGLGAMLEFAVSSMPQISGVNLEFLGLADRAQAGVLEYQRKQSAITTLGEFFAALRLYRKGQGKVLLEMIQKYISDGRLIRIVGKTGEQYVPLTKQPGLVEFDVVVDEATNSPDVKGRTWEALGQLAPMLMKMGAPIPPEALDYSPLPSSLVSKWKEQLQGQQQIPPQVQQMIQQGQQQMQAMGEQINKLTQENQAIKQDKSEKMMEVQLDREIAAAKLQADREETAARLELDRQKAAAEFALARTDKQMQRSAKALDKADKNATLGGPTVIEQIQGGIEDKFTQTNQALQSVVSSLADVTAHLAKPKQIIRDPETGRAIGVQSVG